jgi:DNA replication factor GINS
MESEDISLILNKERETQEINPLPITFFTDVKRYIKELNEEIKKDNIPKSKAVMMLSDELETSIGRIEDIFHVRQSKIYSMAARASTRESNQHKNYNRLLPEEKLMFDTLILSGITLKEKLLDPVFTQEEEVVKEEKEQESMLVRIKRDIPTFMGTDGRNYTLKANDVISLPWSNAQGLIKKNVAHELSN